MIKSLTSDEIYRKIVEQLPKFDKFKDNIKRNISDEGNYFPILYQNIYSSIIPPFRKDLLTSKKYLALLNAVYNTHLSNEAYEVILERIKPKNFDDYSSTLEAFKGCNPKSNSIADALSFGTKVLHTYNPFKNPILDSVVRGNLGLGRLTVQLCLDFREAMNRFVESNEKYFSDIRDILKEFGLRQDYPVMKVLDMALY